VGEPVELALRVLPNDLDVNGHMNNGRYLTVVDLALFTLFIRSGFLGLCLKKGWRPMSGGAVAHFRRGLRVFQGYTLRMTPVGWDDFWNYCRFDFIRDGELCATGFMKGAAVGCGGLIATSEFYPALGYHGRSPELPPDLLGWIAADRLLGERAKR
jgi:acyl-CoA thioesterase FadM